MRHEVGPAWEDRDGPFRRRTVGPDQLPDDGPTRIPIGAGNPRREDDPVNRDEREPRDVSRGLPPRLDPRAGKPPRRGREAAGNRRETPAGPSGRAAKGGRIVATLLSLTVLCASGRGWYLFRVAEADGQPDRRDPDVRQRRERRRRRGDEPAARRQRQPGGPHRRAAARAEGRHRLGPQHRHDDPGAHPGRRVEGVVRLLPARLLRADPRLRLGQAQRRLRLRLPGRARERQRGRQARGRRPSCWCRRSAS